MSIDLQYEYKPEYGLEVYYLDKYYPKKLKHKDIFSELVLGVKSGNYSAMKAAASMLKEVLPDNSYICMVPSSKKGKGCHLFDVLKIIEREKNLHLFVIERTKETGKKSTGEGDRDFNTERQSIACDFATKIRDKNVILMDDISTTGVSLAASKKLLVENGAADVKCITLGNTVLIAGYYNKIIIGLLMVQGLGRKYSSEILDNINTKSIESNKSIYSKLEQYSSSKKSIKVPSYDQFCEYIENAETILQKQEEQGVVTINKNSNNYPEKFKNILAPPVILFAKGNLSLLHGFNHIAIVGSRNATEHGCKVAYRLGQLFAKDNIVVSGLARGCDTYGHRGCIDANGKTVAILPSPVLVPEPKENRELAEKIVDTDGLLLSEYYLGQEVQRSYYIARRQAKAACRIGAQRQQHFEVL